MSRRIRYLALPLAILCASQALAADRAVTAGQFALTLDGVPVGFMKSVEGGGISADVVQETAGATFTKKHIAAPKYEAFVVKSGFGSPSPLYDWVAGSWNGKSQRKNGAITACNFNLDAVTQHDFFNAVLTETTFPALDGASKDPGYLTLKFAPEQTRTKPASGKCAGDASKQPNKTWLPSNFRFDLKGIDTSGVVKIDSFSVTQRPASNSVGDSRDSMKEPGKIAFPNLLVTVSLASAKSWEDWFEDFVIKGNNGGEQEKSGTIVFLAANRTEELARVELQNVGIYEFARDMGSANTDSVRSVKVGLYVESMSLQVGKFAPRKAPAKGAVEKAAARPAKR